MSWGKWGQSTAAIVVDEPPPLGEPVLATDRYCPRCDTTTRWTNEHDHGVRLACHGCGYIVGAPLTDEEEGRAEAYEAAPVTRLRRPYMVV